MEMKRQPESDECTLSTDSKRICLRNEMGFAQVTSALYRLPTDMILKLSDGTISIHRIILASVSPVFERMFYGDFKERNSNEVDLPKDSYKTIKQLIDIIYKGSCEMDDLDDATSLMEVVDCYQINKAPFLHMCGEAILSQLDSSNYLTLLPKYVSVMSEESHKKAADKVMSYTNNDFVTKFDEAKDLPEEVVLVLLSRNDITAHEADIFNFLIQWHDYQAKELNKSLQLTSKLFHSIKYPLIIPQLLSTVVAKCDLVDRSLLSHAFEHNYGSCSPIGENNDTIHHPINQIQSSRKLPCLLTIEWHAQTDVKISHKKAGLSEITYNTTKDDLCILKSTPLRNGIYSFYIFNPSFFTTNVQVAQGSRGGRLAVSIRDVSLLITNDSERCLGNTMLENYDLVTIHVHNNYLFLKRIGCDEVLENTQVKSTICIDGSQPFSVHICREINVTKTLTSFPIFLGTAAEATFKIGDHVHY